MIPEDATTASRLRGSQNDRTIIWRARTEHKGLGSSGKIIWAIGAEVTRTVREVVEVPETVELKWGTQKVFPFPAGTWRAVWKRFDGAEIEYSSSDFVSAFLQLSATGRDLTVRTYGL